MSARRLGERSVGLEGARCCYARGGAVLLPSTTPAETVAPRERAALETVAPRERAAVPTISARLGLLVVLAAERHGVRRRELLAAAKLDDEALLEEDARIPHAIEQALWQEASARVGDELFGLDVIAGAPLGFLGVPDLLLSSEASFGEALATAGRYFPLVREDVVVCMTEEGDEAKLVYHAAEGVASMTRGAVEHLLGALVVMGRACTGLAPEVRRLAVAYPAPKRREQRLAVTRFFGTEAVEFEAPETSVVLDRRALSWRSMTALPRLNGVLREHAERLMQELSHPQRPNGFLLRVRRHLYFELEGGTATLPGLARRLAMSPRSLQRRLAEHGASFGDLLEDVRRELAPRYLEDPSLGLAEIAFRLGYASPQSFHRAFRAWAGESPGRYRRARLSELEVDRPRG
jgi:AraC-like DNA-binding protein